MLCICMQISVEYFSEVRLCFSLFFIKKESVSEMLMKHTKKRKKKYNYIAFFIIYTLFKDNM